MRVAVIGAGLLGQSIVEELIIREALAGFALGPGGFGHGDIEVTKPDSVRAALEGFDVAINTAAVHRLADCEKDPIWARAVNEHGAANVAAVLPTIYISTDYVFGGKDGPHDEVLPGHKPSSVYGQTKLGGELATLERGGIVVRVSSLYGHYQSHKGKSFPDRIVEEFGDLELPTDQVMSPTYAPDAAARIADLAVLLADGQMLGKPGIFHAANAGSCNWYELARQVVRVTYRKGRKVTGRAFHDELRPRNSALRAAEPRRHWALALEVWAKERQRRLEANAVSPLRSAS